MSRPSARKAEVVALALLRLLTDPDAAVYFAGKRIRLDAALQSIHNELPAWLRRAVEEAKRRTAR